MKKVKLSSLIKKKKLRTKTNKRLDDQRGEEGEARTITGVMSWRDGHISTE